MSFFGHFGKACAAAESATQTLTATGSALLGAYNPGLGALVEMIGNAVYSVEQKAAAGAAGAEKKEQVKTIVDVAAPVTMQVISGITGKTLTQPESVAPAIDALIDNIVTLFHAMGVFAPRAATAQAAAPGMTASPAS